MGDQWLELRRQLLIRRDVCVWSSLPADWTSTGYGCQSCLWPAEQGKRNFPCPRSRPRLRSCELGSAVPSRVSPLILHTKAESGAYLRDSTPSSRFSLRFPLEPPCAIGLVPSLSGHAIALPMAFTTETRHRASSSQGSSINGSFLFREPHGPINARPFFPHPLLVQWECASRDRRYVLQYSFATRRV